MHGNIVYLHIKCRRWLERTSKEIVQSDWSLVAKRFRISTEFAAFLKELNR
ncbi:ISAon1 family transposase N-terminal region protein [Flavicella sediminum]